MKNGRLGILVVTLLVLIAVALAIYGPMLFRKRVDEIKTDIKAAKERVITSKGVVESEDEIEISSPVSGTIQEIRGKEGDSIKKGQPLVFLENDKVVARVKVAEAALDEAKRHLKTRESGYRAEEIAMAQSRLEKAQSAYDENEEDYQRNMRLYEKDAITRTELDKAKWKMDIAGKDVGAAKADLEKFRKGARTEEIAEDQAAVNRAAAELKASKVLLDDYLIRSPSEGIVIARFKAAKETVDIGTPILKLIDNGNLRIRAEMEETDVGRVAEGAPVEVTTDAYGERVYHGKVYKVLPSVQRRSQKTFDPVASFDVNAQDIYIRLDDFSGLKHGMSVTVRFLK